jgi:hypothetical protein
MSQAKSPTPVALASFANMFSIGTLYALSTLQSQLPRLLDVDTYGCGTLLNPFVLASFGLSLGVTTCPRLLKRSSPATVTGVGTTLWGAGLFAAGCALTLLHSHWSSSRLLVQLLLSLSFFLGGIGVGWTYLSTVVWTSQILPAGSLARTAIGPLGFSAGATVVGFAGVWGGVDFLNVQTLAAVVRGVGVGIASVGGLTMGLFSDAAAAGPGTAGDTKEEKPEQEKNKEQNQHGRPSSSPPTRGSFQILLFFNALPGMTLLNNFFPPLSPHHQSSATTTTSPLLFTSLALGGLLTPLLSKALSPRTLFITLFSIRGVMLILLSLSLQVPQILNRNLIFYMRLATIATILFAHGVGFSSLPGLVKRRLPRGADFAREYGVILGAWGFAGVVGCWVSAGAFQEGQGGEAECSAVRLPCSRLAGVMALAAGMVMAGRRGCVVGGGGFS